MLFALSSGCILKVLWCNDFTLHVRVGAFLNTTSFKVLSLSGVR